VTDFVALNARLLDRMRADGFAGWDPFDMLNSRLLRATPLDRSALVRLAVIQAGKRSPINLRRALLVPKVRNAKGIALVILGLVQNGDAASLAEAVTLGDWLLRARCDPGQWHHACWGYPFDWQARAFYVPRGRPNVITSVYVARALLALGDAAGVDRFVAVAIDTARFIARHLRAADERGPFIAYIPGEQAFVHNASLWGAAWCGVAGRRAGDQALLGFGLDVARRSVADQREDGAWVYGGQSHHRFIDSFHTGYNLEALHLLGGFEEPVRRGFAWFKQTFIEPDGLVRYYDTNRYPLDTHAAAQAVLTLKIVGKDHALAAKVLEWTVRTLYQPRTGLFAYQRGRWITNRVPYARWTQAWIFYVMAYHNRNSLS
jgi:polysaccharide biosynthesis protein VpsJ